MTEVDPFTQRRYPEDAVSFNVRRWVERLTIKNCSRAVFVAPTTQQMYFERYRGISANHWVSIANGYDEESFVAAEQHAKAPTPMNARIRLLHSGLLYVADRDPSAFFSALVKLRDAGNINSNNFNVVLRAPGNENYYQQLVNQKNISEIVSLEPAISYREALTEMLSVQGLLLFQGEESNANIPAKLYEYLRARRPILALVDPNGDTASVLRAAKIGTIIPIDSVDRIVEGLLDFLHRLRNGTAPILSAAEVKRYSRTARTRELAQVFDAIG
jgi:hypothetical protein